MKKDIFESNNVDTVMQEIASIVESKGHCGVIFPYYNPESGIGEEYSVIGLEENQAKVVKLLKKRCIKSEKFDAGCYLFFSSSISNEEFENARGDFGTLVQFYMY